MRAIEQMLILQQQLNDATSGKGWEQGITNKGKPIDWKRCIYLEAAELVDSYPWKHWKNIDANPDYDNIKIEVVDIWHFVMSEALRQYKIQQKGDITDLADMMEKLPHFEAFQSTITKEPLPVFEQIASVEDMIKTLFLHDDITRITDAFFKMAYDLRINLDELYQLYTGKNILNRFRQDHGYKEGQYIKKWNGEEDNVVMQRIMHRNYPLTPERLYQLLETEYPNK